MKTIYLLLIALLCTYRPLLGQIIISMDSVIYVCGESFPGSGAPAPIQITTNVSGGHPPLTYEWSCDSHPLYLGSDISLYASDFLNDTAIASPIISAENSENGDSIYFRFKVKDAVGNEVTDSILAIFSKFYWNTNPIINEYTLLGDSIWLDWEPNVGGGISPCVYDWSPGELLSDSTVISGFWVKPTETTVFTPTITDANGCNAISTPVFRANISLATIEENNIQAVKISPNSSNGKLKIETSKKINFIELYSSTGKLVLKGRDSMLNISQLQNGIYTVKVYLEDKEIVVRKILKK